MCRDRSRNQASSTSAAGPAHSPPSWWIVWELTPSPRSTRRSRSWRLPDERCPGVDVRAGSAERLPYDDDSFDAALAQLVVHFMADADAGTTLRWPA